MKIFVIMFLIFKLMTVSPLEDIVPLAAAAESDTWQMYLEMRLENVINYAAFEHAITGFKNIDHKRRNILTLIDFSLPSTEERLFVIDLDRKELIHTSHVAHGMKSGDNYATSFSNAVGSHKSSLGFYLTENTYNGRNGYSLVINGLEKGINDNAKARAVVFHAADYCDPDKIGSWGRLGRSQGCPALPNDKNQTIIDAIKGGSVVYIYADKPEYLAQSVILSTNNNYM